MSKPSLSCAKRNLWVENFHCLFSWSVTFKQQLFYINNKLIEAYGGSIDVFNLLIYDCAIWRIFSSRVEVKVFLFINKNIVCWSMIVLGLIFLLFISLRTVIYFNIIDNCMFVYYWGLIWFLFKNDPSAQKIIQNYR